jgi:hypothetical protein
MSSFLAKVKSFVSLQGDYLLSPHSLFLLSYGSETISLNFDLRSSLGDPHGTILLIVDYHLEGLVPSSIS